MSQEERGSLTMHSLPDELMIKIFQDVVDDAIRDRPHVPYAWVSIMLVCRLWRSIAIGSPTLWTLVTEAAFPAIDTVLTRSRDAPLTYKLDILQRSSHEQSFTERELGVLDLHRIRSYELKCPPDVLMQFLAYSYPRNAPLLQLLHLEVQRDIPGYAASWDTPLPSLEDLLVFRGSAKLVRELTAQGPNLRHLNLGYIMPALSISSLLHLVSNLPLLQTLHTDGAIGPNERCHSEEFHIQTRGSRPCILRHLQEFSVDELARLIVPLLDNITVPASARTRIYAVVQSQAETLDFVSSWQNHLSRRLGTIATVPDLDTCVLRCKEWVQHVQLLPADDTFSLCAPQKSRLPSIYSLYSFLDCNDDGYDAARTLAQLPTFLPLSQVRCLSIDVSLRGLPLFRDAFRQMVHVERLCTDAAIAVAILELPREPEDNTSNKPIFPDLTSVTIRSTFDSGELHAQDILLLFEIIASRRLIPEIAWLEQVHVCGPEKAFHECQGHCGVVARFEHH